MKMSSDLDQWLIRPNSTSTKQRVSDPLAAFRKMSISSTESSRKFILPSILTSDNNSTWLATRKNDNDLAKSAANKSNQNQSGSIKINQDQTGSIKINQDDNAKWLLKPLNKSETDLVTLTDEKQEPNPWLAPPQTSVMTTSLDSLPGTFNLPLKFSGGLSKDIWLSKPASSKQTENLVKDLEDWLLVPSSTDSGLAVTGGKNSTFSTNQNSGNISTNLLDEWEKQSKTYNWNANSTSGKISTNPLDEWEKQSMTYNWIVNDNNTSNNTSHVEEWLKNALEDDNNEEEIDEISDDFDDCSIEVIDQD